MLRAWERVGSQFKGSPHRRVEQFLEWAEENAGELAELTYQEPTDAELAAEYERYAAELERDAPDAPPIHERGAAYYLEKAGKRMKAARLKEEIGKRAEKRSAKKRPEPSDPFEAMQARAELVEQAKAAAREARDRVAVSFTEDESETAVKDAQRAAKLAAKSMLRVTEMRGPTVTKYGRSSMEDQAAMSVWVRASTAKDDAARAAKEAQAEHRKAWA